METAKVIEWGGKIATSGRVSGRARRSMYRAERPAARRKGNIGAFPPAGCPDASPNEIATNVPIVAKQFGLQTGRFEGYDSQRDAYIVVCKSARWSIPREFPIPGVLVAAAILNWRKVMRDAGPQDPRAWLQRKGLLEQPRLVASPSLASTPQQPDRGQSAPIQASALPGLPAA